jgi:hypothetical protein
VRVRIPRNRIICTLAWQWASRWRMTDRR